MNPAVLVVEDYADLRSAIAMALSRGHYSCEQATSTRDAIDRLKEHHYDAILLSPTLPLSSDPVMHFLIENQPAELQKVILMTDPDPDLVGAGEYPVLVKPFNRAQLMAKLPHP